MRLFLSPFLSLFLLSPFAAPAFAQAPAEGAPPAPAPPAVVPNPEIAREAAVTAVNACERQGYKTMATVVDNSGRPVVAMTADPQLADILAPHSVRRAQVAATFHEASSDVAQRVKSDTAVYYAIQADPRLKAPEAGGVPLSSPDNPKGAIGVAGAPDSLKDEACARAGAQEVAAKLTQASTVVQPPRAKVHERSTHRHRHHRRTRREVRTSAAVDGSR